MPNRARDGAPNVLFIILDDTGARTGMRRAGASGQARMRERYARCEQTRQVGVSLLSTASFNRLLPAAICPCPSHSQARSWLETTGYLANVG
jgi:hypothetical protein